MMQPYIRSASASDIDDLMSLEVKCGFSPRSKQQLLMSLKHHDVFVLIGTESEKIIGFSIFHRLIDDIELLNIVIDKIFQGKGLGRYLIEHNLFHYQDANIKQCFLEVGEKNAKALSLYLNLGFSQIGRRKDYYQIEGKQQDALLLSCQLLREND